MGKTARVKQNGNSLADIPFVCQKALEAEDYRSSKIVATY